MKSKTGWIASLALSLGGLGLSIWLSSHFYAARGATGGFGSICNLGSALNCDAVAASKYAELVGGIPLSSFTAGWYLAIAILSIITLISSESRRQATQALLAMAGISVAMSAFYLYVMAAVINTYCLFCLFLDGINAGLLAVALMLWQKEKTAPAPRESAWKTYVGVVVGSVFVALVLLRGFDTRTMSRSDLEQVVESMVSSSVLPVSTDASPLIMGPASAPITIVEFSDFQCPYCRRGALILHQVQARWGNQVRVILRNFPLDPSCNPKVQHNMHQVACEAAKVVYCSQQQGKMKPVYETLFENQAKLAPGKTFEMAAAVGADEARLKACVADPATTQAVLRDIEEGSRLGVQSTPTFFLNGRKIEGAYPVEAWDRAIGRLLDAQRAAGGTQ